MAEAVADCAGCHTPRNSLGAEETHKAYTGAVIDGWIGPALTAANPSPIPWTEGELVTYLRTGASPLHGATAATMTDVIHGSLALPIVPDSDVRAIAVYSARRPPSMSPSSISTLSSFGRGAQLQLLRPSQSVTASDVPALFAPSSRMPDPQGGGFDGAPVRPVPHGWRHEKRVQGSVAGFGVRASAGRVTAGSRLPPFDP